MMFPLHRLRLHGIAAETKGQCALISTDQLEIYTQSRDAEFDDYDSYEFEFDNMAYTDHLSVEEHLITTPLSKPNELCMDRPSSRTTMTWIPSEQWKKNATQYINHYHNSDRSPKESIIRGVNRRLRRLFLLFIPVA